MAYDPATVRYVASGREWRQRANDCPDGEEREIFFIIAAGYEQLATLSKNPDGAGGPVEEAVSRFYVCDEGENKMFGHA